MRYVVAFVLALALVASPLGVGAQVNDEGQAAESADTPKAALAIHMQHRLPPYLMLRSSYFLYLDADAINGVASEQTESNAGEPKGVQADGEVASPQSSQEESLSSQERATEVPDIDILSARSIAHYESLEHYNHFTAGSREKAGRRHGGTRSPGAKAGIAVGVIVGVGLVGMGIAAAAILPLDFSWDSTD